jgi:hypothetical protein
MCLDRDGDGSISSEVARCQRAVTQRAARERASGGDGEPERL